MHPPRDAHGAQRARVHSSLKGLPRRGVLNQISRMRHKTAALVAVVKFDSRFTPPRKSPDDVFWRRESNRTRRDAAAAARNAAVEAARDLFMTLHADEAALLNIGDHELRELVCTIIQTLMSIERPLYDTYRDPMNETAFSAITYFAERAHVLVGIAAQLFREISERS